MNVAVPPTRQPCAEIHVPVQKVSELKTALQYLQGEAKGAKLHEVAHCIGVAVLAAKDVLTQLQSQIKPRTRRGRAC